MRQKQPVCRMQAKACEGLVPQYMTAHAMLRDQQDQLCTSLLLFSATA